MRKCLKRFFRKRFSAAKTGRRRLFAINAREAGLPSLHRLGASAYTMKLTWKSTKMAAEIDQYNYDLPRQLIAQQPAASRVDARLLVVDRRRQTLAHHYIRDLPELLGPATAWF